MTSQKIRFCIPLFVCLYGFVMFLLFSPELTGLEGLYIGAPPKGHVILILLSYSHFAIFSFLFFGSGEHYINNFGSMELVRHGSRSRLFAKQFRRIVLWSASLEALSALFYILIFAALKGGGALANFAEAIPFVANTILFLILMLILQFILEILFSAPIAILVTQSFFIVQIVVSGIILNYYPKSIVNYFFMNNFFMSSRVEIMGIDFAQKLLVPASEFLFLLAILYFIGRKALERKDIF